jgi:hypothetical protein
VLCDQKVFQRGHAAKQPDILERAGHLGAFGDLEIRHPLKQENPVFTVGIELSSGAGQRFDPVGLQAFAMTHDDAPFGRFVKARNAIEHRGLAGAVRADQRGDVAASDIEAQVVDGDEAAETHGQMLNRKHHIVIPVLRLFFIHRGFHQWPSP